MPWQLHMCFLLAWLLLKKARILSRISYTTPHFLWSIKAYYRLTEQRIFGSLQFTRRSVKTYSSFYSQTVSLHLQSLHSKIDFLICSKQSKWSIYHRIPIDLILTTLGLFLCMDKHNRFLSLQSGCRSKHSYHTALSAIRNVSVSYWSIRNCRFRNF